MSTHQQEFQIDEIVLAGDAGTPYLIYDYGRCIYSENTIQWLKCQDYASGKCCGHNYGISRIGDGFHDFICNNNAEEIIRRPDFRDREDVRRIELSLRSGQNTDKHLDTFEPLYW